MRHTAILRAVAHLAIWTLITAGCFTFGFFYCTTPTRWYNVRATELITWRNKLILLYPFGNGTTGKTTPLLGGSLSFILIWQWCGTLAVALGSAGLMWLAASSSTTVGSTASSACIDIQRSKSPRSTCRNRRCWSLGAAMKKSVCHIRRLLRKPIAPGGVWRWLLGPEGLSLVDLLLVGLWFGLHIMWLHEMTMRVLDNRRTAPPPPKPRSPPLAGLKTPGASTTNVSSSKGSSPSSLPPSPWTAPRSPPLPASVPSSSTELSPFNAIVRRRMQQAASTPSAKSSNSSAAFSPGSKPPSPVAKALSPPPPIKKLKALPVVVQDSVAKYSGWVGRLDILLLFFPLPRCNFLHWLLGADFPTLIKYHRWLGQGTILMYSIHGITYMSMWTHDGVLASMLSWGMDAGVNRLSGLIALCGGWLLWVTSVPWVRRRLFNLFYGCHILGATVFMLFAFMHRKDVATWVMPGIFLYLLDVVLRTVQQNFNCVRMSTTSDHPACAVTAQVASGGGVLSLSVRCHQSLSWVGSDVVFLNVPAISWWQWHPFTVACAPAPAMGTEHVLQLHIKKYNRWTQRLISRLSSDAAPLTLYVSGPYDSGNRQWIQDFDTHVFVAGGIGITPALGMIRELIAHRSHGSAGDEAESEPRPRPGRVILIWVSRTMDELMTLPYDVLGAANNAGCNNIDSGLPRAAPPSPSPWLHLRLFLTAPSNGNMDSKILEAVPPPKASNTNGALEHAPNSSSQTSIGSPRSILAITPGTDLEPGSEEMGGTRARPLSHPYLFSPLLWMAAVLLSFGGGFTGLICAQSYDAYIARNVATRKDFSYVGMLQFAALGLGCMLPPAVLMLAVHLHRRLAPASRWQVARLPKPTLSITISSAVNDQQALADAVPTDTDSNATPESPKMLIGKTIPSLESYITHGRPDVAALLHQIASTGALNGSRGDIGEAAGPWGRSGSNTSSSQFDSNSDCTRALEELRVGVFAAGPEPLVARVAAECASLNGVWGCKGRAYLHFKAATHEL